MSTSEPATGVADPPFISTTLVNKWFGTVHAVRDVSFVARGGAVTAIVGENGAGKSTLMKILSGVESPDSGSLQVHGRPARFATTRDATRGGVGMVYQETALVPALTVWENVVLGSEYSRRGSLDRRACRERVRELSRLHGLPVPLDAVTSELPVSVQQQVEILKVLHRSVDIIILDEPTSVLTPQESRGLFEAVERLKAEGKAILFISHKLGEVIEIADSLWIMRQGQVVAQRARGDTDVAELARLIVGGDLPEMVGRERVDDAERILSVEDVTCRSMPGRRQVANASFDVRAGVITGVAGVAGSGQDELVATISGITPPISGSVTFKGLDTVVIDARSSPSESVRRLREAGIAYLPADRNGVSSIPNRPLWASAISGRHWRPPYVNRWHWLRRNKARGLASQIISDFNVRAQGPNSPPRLLSGGNLQKFLAGRELMAAPKLLIAEEPTRGIDIGSARLVRQRIREVANGGGAVVLVSTDLDELLELCDDVIVLFSGRVVAHEPRAGLTAERLGQAMTGTGGSAGGDQR